MRAYKVLIEGRSPFTGHVWPQPSADGAGDWITAIGQLGLCVNGVHACSVGQLPQWLGSQLWRVELGGEIVRTEAALVASRARLLSPVSVWDQAAMVGYCRACAARAGTATATATAPDGVAPVLMALRQMADAGHAAGAGYWSAVLAGQRAAGRRSGPVYGEAFAAERELQARWLREQLELADDDGRPSV